MLNRVLFVERSGELLLLARLSTKGVEPLIGPDGTSDGYEFVDDEHHTVCTVACGPYFQTDCFG